VKVKNVELQFSKVKQSESCESQKWDSQSITKICLSWGTSARRGGYATHRLSWRGQRRGCHDCVTALVGRWCAGLLRCKSSIASKVDHWLSGSLRNDVLEYIDIRKAAQL